MRSSLLFLIGAATILAAPSAYAEGRPEGLGDLRDFSRGASLYSSNCGRCHNPRGPSEYSDRHWPLVVTHMRVIAGLPGDQARAIETFLRASNNPPPREPARSTPESAAPPESGEVLLTRFGCRGCHKIAGQGGLVGPSLDGLFGRRSEDWVRVQIQTPREHNPKTAMPQFGLTNDEVTAIVDVLRSPH